MRVLFTKTSLPAFHPAPGRNNLCRFGLGKPPKQVCSPMSLSENRSRRTMLTQRSFFGFACRAAALCFLFAGTASLTHAQSAPSSASGLDRPLLVSSAYANPFAADLAKGSSSSSSSSSSNSDEVLPDTTALGHFDLFSKQPPPRRRYGRPNYADSNTNKDGSPKWVGMIGGGFTLPVGNLHKYDTTSWGLQAGGGRNYSKSLAVLLQFDYDHFGLQNSTIKN